MPVLMSELEEATTVEASDEALEKVSAVVNLMTGFMCTQPTY
jgi:hypothetical protein